MAWDYWEKADIDLIMKPWEDAEKYFEYLKKMDITNEKIKHLHQEFQKLADLLEKFKQVKDNQSSEKISIKLYFFENILSGNESRIFFMLNNFYTQKHDLWDEYVVQTTKEVIDYLKFIYPNLSVDIKSFAIKKRDLYSSFSKEFKEIKDSNYATQKKVIKKFFDQNQELIEMDYSLSDLIKKFLKLSWKDYEKNRKSFDVIWFIFHKSYEWQEFLIKNI